MAIKKPVHPGKRVKQDCLEAFGLSITDAARALGVSRASVSRLVNCRVSLSPEMAIRLSKAFGSTPEAWLQMQFAYDLAQVEKKAARIKVQPYLPQESRITA
ncbi:MAG: HigA family addiction module antitoxin [Chloroflexota bacterium]